MDLFFPFSVSVTLPSQFYFPERKTQQNKVKSVLSASMYPFCLFAIYAGRKLNVGSVRAGILCVLFAATSLVRRTVYT